MRRGGLYPGASCGALRTILSYAAHSRRVAYLDDSSWWAPDHLHTLCEALNGRDWAFSLRWYVDPQTQQPLCIDEWEAVGPDAGIFKSRFGGFVPASCLMLDKVVCEPVLRWWSFPLPGDSRALSEDRNVFHFLREQTGKTSVPQIFVGGTFIGGYYELAQMDRQGELDELIQS